ncbi:MAG TPA: type II toxin-antitoxin system PemK/MazF family toxin [Candidatus Paceibacterota bacterium]
MRKGAVVLVPFPFTDLSGAKVRPALVLALSRGEDCTLAFVSSVQKRRGAYDMVVKCSRMNGLKADSVIKLDKIATLQRSLVLGSIGGLEANYMAQVDTKLKTFFRL